MSNNNHQHQHNQNHKHHAGGNFNQKQADPSGLISEKEMAMQQQAANSEPPLAPTDSTRPPEVAVVQAAPVPTVHSCFHSVAVTAMFTLNLTDERMFDLKQHLSRVDLNGTEANLYNPFRKAGKPGEPKAPAEGVVRSLLGGLFEATDTINNSRVMVLGSDEEVHKNLSNVIKTLTAKVESFLPAAPTTVVTELEMGEDEEGEEVEADQLLFGDIVRVRSWLNSPQLSGTLDQIDTIASHNAVINVHVSSGALYDSPERLKVIKYIESILTLAQASREESSTTILLAVNIDPQQLEDKGVRDLIGVLLEDEGFALYTRNELHRLDVADWLPQSKASVDSDLLNGSGDLLLVRMVGDDDEEDDGEDGAGGENAEVSA